MMVLQCNICSVEPNHAMALLQVTVHQRPMLDRLLYATVVFTQYPLYADACVFIALVVKVVSLYGMFTVQWCWIVPERKRHTFDPVVYV